MPEWFERFRPGHPLQGGCDVFFLMIFLHLFRGNFRFVFGKVVGKCVGDVSNQSEDEITGGIYS